MTALVRLSPIHSKTDAFDRRACINRELRFGGGNVLDHAIFNGNAGQYDHYHRRHPNGVY